MKRLEQISDDIYNQCLAYNRELVQDFLDSSMELSDKTLRAYKSNLKIWLNWIREHLSNKQIVDIKPREYLRYQNWLLSLNHSSSDIANKRSAISSLNNFIVAYYSDEHPTFHNFINKSIKKPEKSFVNEKVPPTKDELEKMVTDIEASEHKYKYQLIAYLKFTWETGCRRAETRQIMKDIIHSEPKKIEVKVKDENGKDTIKEATYYVTPKLRCKGKGKTGKLRSLKFSDFSMDALKKWVEQREDVCPYMFVSHYNGKVEQVAEGAFNRWSKSVFEPLLGRRFHPHALRESRATSIVLEDGKSIEAAKSLLGHENSETTKIYVIGMDEDSESDELFV